MNQVLIAQMSESSHADLPGLSSPELGQQVQYGGISILVVLSVTALIRALTALVQACKS